MVVLNFHVSPEVMGQIRREAEATGKTISEVSRDWLMKGKLEADKNRTRETVFTVATLMIVLVFATMTMQLIWI